MLQFNPYFRPTARELLKNPIFDSIRIPACEKKAEFKLVIEHDLKDHGYYKDDYEISDKEAEELIKSHQVNILKELIKLK